MNAKLVKEARTVAERFGCGYLAGLALGSALAGRAAEDAHLPCADGEFQVLILDEPCAGLDPVARENFLCWLKVLASETRRPSLVMVTHHVEEILPCFTHVLLLKAGTVYGVGSKQGRMLTSALSDAYGAVAIAAEWR